jgi:hypothetical protein
MVDAVYMGVILSVSFNIPEDRLLSLGQETCQHGLMTWQAGMKQVGQYSPLPRP